MSEVGIPTSQPDQGNPSLPDSSFMILGLIILTIKTHTYSSRVLDFKFS